MSEFIDNSVRKLRRAGNITQKDLAKTVGVSRQTIIALEKGHYTPSIMLAMKLARFFKKPVESVFSYRRSK